MFRQNGLTAAVLTHVIDPHFISMLEYKEQEKLKFLRIDSDLGSALKTEQTEEEKQQQEEQDKQLIERFKPVSYTHLYETKNFIKKLHKNSFMSLVNTLYDNNDLTEQDMDELSRWLEEKKQNQ